MLYYSYLVHSYRWERMAGNLTPSFNRHYSEKHSPWSLKHPVGSKHFFVEVT
jgi:hypothetical protein